MTEKYRDFLSWVIYQIYPRSFQDTNGDGIGDLNGVRARLDYLKDLGVNAIWLCPCYKSPNDDNGYDVADYRDIMDEFGNMDDMKALISESHARGIHVIMDLVPNHTSSAHKWFRASKQSRDNPYSDYYYWFDEPPTDWNASFGGKAWEYCPERKQYYLHSYCVSQPDLNWDNPKVRDEMKAVVDFWASLGVDGFRIDVIDQISKDIPNGRNCFGPHLHEYIHELFGREEAAHLFTVGECWASTGEDYKKHCDASRNELSTLFQFDHLECGRSEKFVQTAPSLAAVRDVLVKWQTFNQQNDLLQMLFTDNHDNAPFLSRVGNDKELRYESATCIAAMFYTLKGVALLYQGQEFGTVSPRYDDISDFRDVEAINAYNGFLPLGKEEALKRINFGSRDNSRRPIAWDGSEYGGFSTVAPWTPVHSEKDRVNLDADIHSEKSIHAFYKRLLAFRRATPELLYGDFTVLSKPTDPFFRFTRSYEGKTVEVLCNFEIASDPGVSFAEQDLLLSNYKDRKDGSTPFRPYEIAIYRVK